MKYSCLLMLIIGLLRPAHGAVPVQIRNPERADNLFDRTELLVVEAGQVSIDQLLQQPGRYPFVPTRPALIKPKNQRYGYWLRLTMENQTSESLFLHLIYTGTEHSTIYEVADNQVLARHQLGSLEPERGYSFLKSNQLCPLSIRRGQTHTVYIYLEGVYTAVWPLYCRATTDLIDYLHRSDLFYGLYYGFILIIVVYSLLLYVRLREADTIRYAIWVVFMGLQLALFRGHTNEFFWPANPAIERYATVLAGITGLVHIPFTLAFLRLSRQSVFYKVGVGVFVLYAIGILLNVVAVSLQREQVDIVPLVALIEGLFSITAGVVVYRRGFRPALFYVVGNLAFFASIFVFLLYAAGQLPHAFWTYNSIHIGSGTEIILFTLALTYKINLLKQRQEEAVQEQLRLAEANRELVEKQNVVLEEKVRQRTDELNDRNTELETAMTTLQATQNQLIEREKMASLGELMAGIAHEIQNPLNFVNNFAELGIELLGELKNDIEAGHSDEALELTAQLQPNIERILHHGKRAEQIVNGMLQQSRSGSSLKQATDINALAQDYLQLVQQTTLAQPDSLAVELHTDFDARIGLLAVMPQELGRVLLNLYTNAFYAVQEKQKTAPADYQPTVWVSTHRLADATEIHVRDNGTGIPDAMKQKIFQPFFTTKPTGVGTGLGLSLSYDVITKGHGGSITVVSKEGEGTEFTIHLPRVYPG